MKETDLAGVVVTHLQEMGWEVYQEVSMGNGYPRADIVAVLKPRIWVIECKTSFSLALLEQALYWTRYAHLVSVAVPRPGRNCKGREAATRFCITSGIGVGYVGTERFDSIVPPLLRRRVMASLSSCLVDEQKTWAPAGSARGNYYTPFAGTRRSLVEFVRRHPGATLKECIDSVQHHYAKDSVARNSISRLIANGVISELELRHDDDATRVYLASPVEARP